MIPTVEGVVALLSKAVEDLCSLGLFADAEDVSRTIRFLTEESDK